MITDRKHCTLRGYELVSVVLGSRAAYQVHKQFQSSAEPTGILNVRHDLITYWLKDNYRRVRLPDLNAPATTA